MSWITYTNKSKWYLNFFCLFEVVLAHATDKYLVKIAIFHKRALSYYHFNWGAIYLHHEIEPNQVPPIPIHMHRLLHSARKADIMSSLHCGITTPSFNSIRLIFTTKSKLCIRFDLSVYLQQNRKFETLIGQLAKGKKLVHIIDSIMKSLGIFWAQWQQCSFLWILDSAPIFYGASETHSIHLHSCCGFLFTQLLWIFELRSICQLFEYLPSIFACKWSTSM